MFWKSLAHILRDRGELVMLYVLESSGSSPGRQGFKLWVDEDGEMDGTIGGGIMEQKLVELARNKLSGGGFSPFMKKQIHKDDASTDKSGMICDGEQTVAFYHLTYDHLPELESLLISDNSALKLDQHGISFVEAFGDENSIKLQELSETSWSLVEQPGIQPTAYIFGGGHVGLSMSGMMSQLGFYVVVLDDREGLNTLYQNKWADEIKIIDYRKSDEFVKEGLNSYVIIMSFGYRPDEVILRRLIGKDFRYIGMMGSQNKVDTMWEELRKDGVPEEQLKKIHAPIGLSIKSETTDEIAVSVAAEIIREKNTKK